MTHDPKTPETAAEKAAAYYHALALFLGLQVGGRPRQAGKHRNAPRRKGYGHVRRLLKRIRVRGMGAG